MSIEKVILAHQFRQIDPKRTVVTCTCGYETTLLPAINGHLCEELESVGIDIDSYPESELKEP